MSQAANPTRLTPSDSPGVWSGEVVQFLLDDQAPNRNDPIRVICNTQDKILFASRSHPIVAVTPIGLGNFADGREHAEDVKESAVVIFAEGTERVAGGQGGRDGGRDQRRVKEGS